MFVCLRPQSLGISRDGRSVEQDNHGLENRTATESPLNMQPVHQILVRNLLVCLSSDTYIPHLLEKCTERRGVGQIRAEHQRIEQEADQLRGFGVVTVGK